MFLELITNRIDFDSSLEDVSYNDAAKEDVLIDKDSKWRVALRHLSIHTPNDKLQFEVISRPEPDDQSNETTSPLPVSPRLLPKSTFKDNGDPDGGAGPSNAPAAPQPTERTLQISQLEERLQRSTISPPLSRPPNTLLPSTGKHSRTSTTPSSEGSQVPITLRRESAYGIIAHLTLIPPRRMTTGLTQTSGGRLSMTMMIGYTTRIASY